MPTTPFTPEQAQFLAKFADDWNAGRRFLCYGARATVGLGAVLGAISGIILGIRALLGVKW